MNRLWIILTASLAFLCHLTSGAGKLNHKTHWAKETVTFTCVGGVNNTNFTTVSLKWIKIDGYKVDVPGLIEENNLTNVISGKAEEDRQSTCQLNNTVQLLKIHLFNQTYFAFEFWANRTLDPDHHLNQPRYSLRSVVLYESNQTTNLTEPNIRFHHPLGLPQQAFKCDELEFSGQGHTIVVNDLHFWAFQNDTVSPNPSYMVCEPVAGNSMVPIAVGGTLLVFMAISLGIYFWRRRMASS